MRRFRSSKIVATVGPASSCPQMLEKLFMAGVDVFRLNFSHGSHEDHRRNVDTIRALEIKTGRPIGILLDLQGPKLRIGTFKEGSIHLLAGQSFLLTLDDHEGNVTGVHFPHPELLPVLEKGTELLLDDGKIRLVVESLDKKSAATRVVVGGELSNRKGLNIPGVLLPVSAMTTKDKQDLDFGLTLGIDWVALSFVQKPEDVEEARALIVEKGGTYFPRLVSKIEKPLAVENMAAIVALSDGIMVARGDLGVEMPPERVPAVQKRLIHACRRAGKPVIVATQMLDSMIHAPAPTRAEASDVATAIYEGADAVMLSAESASGEYPEESVAMMDRIIKATEADPLWRMTVDAQEHNPEHTTSDAITVAAKQVAETIEARAIVAFTESGSTALRAARERPSVPIVGLTPRIETARQLALVWGVHALKNDKCATFADAVMWARKRALDEGFAEGEDHIVITAGVPFGVSGSTNILRIARINHD